ncbi:MAG TPA: hypothetical protein VMW06_08080 [Desulfobacterales bacterium]|nr:hypothetical protein [Desulfobacterales bacterium]
MANDDKALGADEVEARLSELLSDFLPGSKAPIKAKGKVVRTDSKGIALEFEIIPDL